MASRAVAAMVMVIKAPMAMDLKAPAFSFLNYYYEGVRGEVRADFRHVGLGQG